MKKSGMTIDTVIELLELTLDYCAPEDRSLYNRTISYLADLRNIMRRMNDTIGKLVRDGYCADSIRSDLRAQPCYANRYDIIIQTVLDHGVVKSQIDTVDLKQQLLVCQQAIKLMATDLLAQDDMPMDSIDDDLTNVIIKSYMQSAREDLQVTNPERE